MEIKLTAMQKTQLCSYMRVIDLMGKNEKIMDEVPEMRVQYEKLCVETKKIMDTLTDKQRDEILEMHKKQMEDNIKKELKKKKK
jgi:hypothetical protein